MKPSNVAQGRTRLFVEFYRKAIEVPSADLDGIPEWKDTIMVRKMVPGDPTSIVDTAAIINKRHPNADNNLFPDQYKRFLAGESQEANGVPLTEFHGIADSERQLLNFLNVRTVEQLAEMSDADGVNVRGFQALKRKAQDFLKARGDQSHVLKMSAELAKRDAETKAMQTQLSDMAAKLEALQAEKAAAPEKSSKSKQ